MFNILAPSFASLFKKYRLLANFSTLGELADALADEGLQVDITILSRWQTGERIPHDRETILVLIKIFQAHRAITKIDDANGLLEVAGFGFLTHHEVSQLFPNLVSQHLPGNFTLSSQLDPELIALAPTLIKSLRIQGHIPSAVRVAQFFEQQLIAQERVVNRRMEILAKIYAEWSRTLSDCIYQNDELEDNRKMCYQSWKMGEIVGNESVINQSIYNLACTEYVAENWNLSKDLLVPRITQTQNVMTRMEMIIILLFDLAILNQRELFNHYRTIAENLATEFRCLDLYHADSLIEAVSRGLAIMRQTNESKQMANQIMYPRERPFLESQMIKHELITLYCEARLGKLVDIKTVDRLEQQAQNPRLAVFYRHQYQIKQLVENIKKFQIK